MHRVVLWVEQGRQVVDSQLVCTTPAAGLRVMLANHSREAAAVLLLSEIGTFLCRSLAVYTIQDERFAPFINLWQRPIHKLIDPALWVAADGAVLFHLQFLPAAT